MSTRRTYQGVGFYGKIPTRGDFLVSGLPSSFVDAAESWVRTGMMALEREPGWQQAYLSAPIWQFACAAGVWDEHPWCGIMMPSVDQVGRYFPLLVAKPTAQIGNALLFAMQSAAQKALDPNLSDIDGWKRQFVQMRDQDSVSRYDGLMSPPMGGTFRALDAEGAITGQHNVGRLGVDLFRALILTGAVTAEVG